MKKNIFVFTLLFFQFMISSVIAKDYIIRNVYWGINIDDVRTLEADTPPANKEYEAANLQSDTHLWYKESLFQKDTYLHYIFFQKKLIACTYEFLYTLEDVNIYADFRYMLKELINKYDMPDVVVLPSDKNYVEARKNFLLQNATSAAIWNFKNKRIMLRLFPPDNLFSSETKKIILSYEPTMHEMP